MHSMYILKCLRDNRWFYIQHSGAAYNFVCKYGWGYQHEDYCYKKFLGTSTTWSNAQSTCRRHGGFLVSIRDQRKQNHIQGTYKCSVKLRF